MSTKAKKRPAGRSKPRQDQEQIVYSQAKPFNGKRFFLRLLTVLAIVLAFTFSLSIFFRVNDVNVSGMENYTAYQIYAASGLTEGDHLIGLSKAAVSARIMEELRYVNSVQIRVKLPGTVFISVTETDVAYEVESTDGGLWLVDSQGRVLDPAGSAADVRQTRILGVKLTAPQTGESAVAASEGEGTSALGTEQLQAALSLAQYMEACGILGEATGIDVTNLDDMVIWYGTQYEIRVGDTANLSGKVALAKGVIDQNGEDSSGIVDVTMTVETDGAVFIPVEP